MPRLQLTGQQRARIIGNNNVKAGYFNKPERLDAFLDNAASLPDGGLSELIRFGFQSDVKPEQHGAAAATPPQIKLTPSQQAALKPHFEKTKQAPKTLEEALSSADKKVRDEAFEILSKHDAHNELTDPLTYAPLVKKDDFITEGYGIPAYKLQADKAALDAAYGISQKPYKKNPHKEFVSSYDRKKKASDDLDLFFRDQEREKRAKQFPRDAEEIYKSDTGYADNAKKIQKLLKASSINKKADKLTSGFKHRLDEINEKYGDYASDNLAKLLKPFQHGDMRHHGQTGHLASNFLSNVAKHREKEKAHLLERVGERAVDRAHTLSAQKASLQHGLIGENRAEQNHKLGKLEKNKNFYDQEKDDFESDIDRTLRKHQGANESLQAKKNFASNEWKNREDYQEQKADKYRAAVHEIPAVEFKEKEIKEPEPKTHDMTRLGKALGALGGAAAHKKGGRIRRVSGGELLQESTENAQRNNMDPLQSLKNVSRYDQIKAIEQKMKDRQQHKKGEKVVAQAPSNPIEEGSFMAKQYALRDKVLAHAERLQKPRETSWVTKGLDAVAKSFADDKTYGGVAKAYQAGREGTQKEQQEEDARHKEAAGVHHDVAKMMYEEHKDNRHHDIEDRKAKAQEAHYKATEAQHERHHQESLSKQDLAEKRFNALHGKAGIERPFNEKEHKRLKEAKALKQKAAHLIKQAQELRELTNPETGIKTGNLLGNALESVGSHAGQNWLAGDRAKAERVRTITGDLIFSKHGELKNIPRSNEILARLDQVKPSLNMSPEAFLKAVDDVEILGHHLNELASETAGDLEGSSHAPSDHSAPDYPDEQKEADEKELQDLYAKRDAVRTHNRKKLGDIVQRHKRADGGPVAGGDVWKAMMNIPLTRDLIMGLQGA